MKKKMDANYITQSNLLGRGWTKKMIQDYGLEPDMEKTNPHYHCAPPMKLYELNNILKIESEPWFKERYAASLKRRASAKKAVQTKHEKMMAYIKSIPITIPDWPKETAFKKAIKHYNDYWQQRGRYDKYISDYRTLDSETLERITKNMFRHLNVNYDYTLCKCYGKVGVDTAHDYLKDKINAMVNEKYGFEENRVEKTTK